MFNHTDFIKQNKDKLIKTARSTNKYNEKDQCLISKDADDFIHDNWANDKEKGVLDE